MKLKPLVSLSLFYSLIVLAQNPNDKILYLDSLHKTTTESNHKFKRIIKNYKLNQQLYEVAEYYNSGTVKMEGFTNNKNTLQLVGICKTYYENGNKQTLRNFSKSISGSKQFSWYENGQKEAEIETFYDSINHIYDMTVLKFWDKNGVQKIIDGNGEFEINNEHEYSKGNYNNGKKSGVWTGIDKKYNFTYTEKYVNGILLSGTSIDSNNVEHQYNIIFQRAEPKKGYENFNTSYRDAIPLHILNKDDEHYEFIHFTIDPQGNVTDIDLTETEHKLDKKRLTRLFKKHSQWHPCIFRGIKIPQKFSRGLTVTNYKGMMHQGKSIRN